MDVVIRTPHGEAEITIARAGDETAIADVVERVTGSASPPTADVDGRAILTSATIGGSGVVTGSVIDLGPPARTESADAVVELVQVAGWGAGARHALGPGTYRVGPGRRVNAADLDMAPVDSTAFELSVDGDGGATVTAGELPLRIDGVAVGVPTPWTDGILDVAARAFELDHDPARLESRARAGDRSGTVVFNRPPRPGPPPVPPPISVAGEAHAHDDGGRSSRRRRRPDGSARPSGGWQDMLREEVTARRQMERRRRLDRHPHVAAAARLAREAAPRLWSARPDDDGAYELAIGLGDVEWTPAISYGDRQPAEVDAIVAELGPLPMVPVTVDLRHERGIAFVGSTEFARAGVRGLLVEACVQHGPADLDVVVLTDPDRAPVWEWVKWLPHCRTSGVAHVLVALDQVDGWVASIRHGRRRTSPPNHLTLAVVDEPAWWRERAAPVRPLMGDASSPVRFVALASGEHDIPAVCTTLVHEQPDDLVRVARLSERTDVEGVHPFLLPTSVAAATARGLAPFDDPDLAVPAASTLAASVPIRELLGPANLAAATIAARWRAASTRASARTPIGVTHRETVEVDFERDGPHLLIGGSEGAGKSELLRTIVVGLAAGLPPDAITFALLDLEGSSTFASVASLPHVVMHHDTADPHLIERSMRCLRAELLGRDESAWHGQAPPRLVIVVDEPGADTGIVSELLDIATGGERLGAHLIVASHHPSAVLADPNAPAIGIRVALRLTDQRDSTAMIGGRDAARLPRRTPGRGWLRVGTGEPVEFQAATVSISHGADSHRDLELRPYVVGRELSPMELRVMRGANGAARRALSSGGSGSDLARLVVEITSAAATVDQSRSRWLCPEPLPDQVDSRRLDTGRGGDGVPYALVDLPDQQRQQIRWWEPGRSGSLLIHGTDGAGTSSLVESLAIGAAERYSADDLHLYVIDSGARAPHGALAPLAALPHTGAVIRFDDLPRVEQLVGFVLAEITDRTATIESARRRALPPVTAHDTLLPHIVVVIDDVGALHQFLHGADAPEHVWADVVRIARDGPAVGVCVVVTAKRPADVPGALAAQIPARLVMRLSDVADYASFGLRPVDIPAFAPGRALDPTERVELQIVRPAVSPVDAIAALAAAPARFRPPTTIESDPR